MSTAVRVDMLFNHHNGSPPCPNAVNETPYRTKVHNLITTARQHFDHRSTGGVE